MVKFMVKSIVKIFRENRLKRRMFPNVEMVFLVVKSVVKRS